MVKTGKQEDVLSVSEGVIEASPAVYDNYAVVGTRDCKNMGNQVTVNSNIYLLSPILY